MKILITGGLGFIGSHAAVKFASEGNDVIVIDNLSRPRDNLQKKTGNPFNWTYFDEKYPKIVKIKEDVRNFTQLKEIFITHRPDAVIHAAGQTSAVGSIDEPMNDFENNVIGLFNTLEISRITGTVKKFIFLSTNKVYGGRVNDVELREEATEYVPLHEKFKGIKEDYPIDDSKHTPYGISKLTGDLYTQEYGRLYGIDTLICRMSCIYGDRQFGFAEQGWLAHLIINTLKKQPITIYGNGKQVRDVLYIDDLTDLYNKFLHSSLKTSPNIVNVGGGISNSLSLINGIRIIETLHKTKISIKYEAERPGDQKYYVSDITKASSLLHWQPRITPAEGIKRTYQWLYEHQELFK